MQNYLKLEENEDLEKIKEPAKIIKNGGIVVFPTETVYGIGVNGLNKQAIEKLYKIKKRPTDKPISLLVSDMQMIEYLAKDISDIEYRIMKAFFPGPLTIILKKKEIIPDILTANKDTVGIRMPSDKIAQKLIEYVKSPIATTSANISGNLSGIEIKDIINDFGQNVDYYIDSGKSKIGTSSTIVEVINGIPHILRKGSITKEQIDNCIK